MTIRLTLLGVNEEFDGINALRERAGQLRESIAKLGDAFTERKKQFDEDDTVELWPGETRTEFDGTNAALDAVEEAISREEEAAAVAARVAQANRQQKKEPERTQIYAPEETRVIIPANVRRTRLTAFDGEKAEQDAYASGMWIRGMLLGDHVARDWCVKRAGLFGVEPRALSETVNIKGGHLVPPQFSSTVIRLVEDYGVAARECQVVPMASDTFSMPRRTGGVTLYALTENQEVTASDTGWDAVTLTAKKWGALTKYSAELQADSTIILADYLARECAHAIALKQDQCLFLGDGSDTYQGIVGVKSATAAGSEHEAASGNTAFSTLDLTDFESVIGKLPQYAEANAKWYISKAGWAASMMRLADAAGGNTAEVIEGQRTRTFLGYPVVITQVTNSTLTAQTSTEGLVYFGDVRQSAMLGMRGEIRMKVAEERYVEFDQLAFLAFVRFDINVHETGGASTAGSILQLKTPSS